MKLKLKRWVKVILYLLVIVLLIISIKDIFTKKTIVNEVGKHYICYGSFIQICNGETYE